MKIEVCDVCHDPEVKVYDIREGRRRGTTALCRVHGEYVERALPPPKRPRRFEEMVTTMEEIEAKKAQRPNAR